MLADWLTGGTNPFFAKSVVNRVWFHLVAAASSIPWTTSGLEPFGQRCPARLPAKDFVEHQFDVRADPDDHEFAPISSAARQRFQQGRQQVFLTR